ncbi:cysteine desulfurase [Scopulibacillus daqui]|uniref:cysteine desulfurase n=1 Tax=Scopulibacillus daqui TaxID=1469162 RepID=A0ABS2Q0Q1_9BACL|nr:cysteine desulfurase family protein [Scopulibacillus daqui]MBM7645864.1 cysteine desulfurase [Scopulibacillus daqui]
MKSIYLDHAATTPIHPDVVSAMVEVYQNAFGNPSSIHQYGRAARKYLDNARETVSRMIGSKPNEIVFTSGGTESDNMAVLGAAFARKDHGKHIITTKIEHHAVLNACRYLESVGFDVTYLDVNQNGMIDLSQLERALRKDTILVTIMYANNEVGTVQPIREIAALLENHQALFHTDAVQAFGMIDLDVCETAIDLLSMTAHKINGPKGVGFLYIREGVQLVSRAHGGEQERKRRAGTQNVPGIVGLEKAVAIASEQFLTKIDKYIGYRKTLCHVLDQHHVKYEINGDPEHYLPHILNLYFPGIQVETLLMNLDLAGVAVSSGSACTAGSVEPSHVLTAMFGKDSDRAYSSIRISFGYGLTEETVEEAGKIIAETVNRLTQS